jgi:hypothetical protein
MPSAPARRLATAERLGNEVRRLLRPSAKQFGFAVTDLLLGWSEIVGTDLSRRALPEKLMRSSEGAVLTIRARGPAALEIQHDAPRLLERLNAFLGEKAIARIKVHQGELSLSEAPREALRRRLDPDQRRELEDRSEIIDHEDLRAALIRLGQAVLTNAQK